MNRLTYVFVWLSRIFHCRGFGVQSPTDYSFVRYVINEHWPYYKYGEVGQGDGWLTRRLGRLYFRLANWRQPETVVLSGYEPYVKAGCCKCRVVENVDTVDMAIVSTRQELECLLPKCRDDSVVVLDKLYRHKELWQWLLADSRVVISYDLYYCGIVLFNQKRTRQHYIINF